MSQNPGGYNGKAAFGAKPPSRKVRCAASGFVITSAFGCKRLFAVPEIDPARPVLIAGPTGSGKSALALALAERHRGVILNADALQVYGCWRVLTARPDAADEARAPHRLFGHIAHDAEYSVGKWLREIAEELVHTRGGPAIIVGGTGLYFSCVTNGLADIPDVSNEVRSDAIRRLRSGGLVALLDELQRDDPATAARIDRANPMRVQRAWEVLRSTGRGLADWQDATPPPLLPLTECNAFVLDAPKDWLSPRLEARLHQMVANGALDECRANLEWWDPTLPSARAIGAPEFIAYLTGECDLETAIANAFIATRRYAKRQRSWFRARMQGWTWLSRA